MNRGKILTSCAVLLIACGGDSDSKGCARGFGSNGEIGDGTFQYVCGDSDQACVSAQGAEPFGTSLPNIARGGSFALTLRPSGDASLPEAKLVPAVGLALEARGAGFFAKDEGLEPILAVDTGGARVIDLVHLRVLAPSSIAVTGAGGSGPSLSIGTEANITAAVRATDPDGGAPLPLAGVAATFTVADETVATIVSQRNGLARVTGRRVGETQLTAALGDLKTSVALRVEGAGPTDAGTDAADSSIIEGGADAN